MKRIDLIPREATDITSKRWLKTYFLKSRTLRAASIILVIIILINLWQATSVLRYKIAIKSGKKTIVKLERKVNESQKTFLKIQNEKELTKKEIKRLDDKLSTLLRIHRDRYAWASILKDLSELVPENLWVNKLDLNKELITITGTTLDNGVVSDFMARLDESKIFTKTSFNYTKKGKFADNPVIDFEVTTHIAFKMAKQ